MEGHPLIIKFHFPNGNYRLSVDIDKPFIAIVYTNCKTWDTSDVLMGLQTLTISSHSHPLKLKVVNGIAAHVLTKEA